MHRIFLLITTFILSSGCDFKEMYKSSLAEETADGERVIALLIERDFDAIQLQLHQSLATPENLQELEKVSNYFPAEQPILTEATGSNVLITGDSWRGTFTFQYQFSDRWLVANTTLTREGSGPLEILGIHVQPISGNLEELNAFELSGKPITNYIFIILAIVIPAFIIVVTVICARTPIPKRKWLWMLFVLMGLVQCSLNWSTGHINVNPVSFQLLGAGFIKGSPYSPVVISIAFPLGAIIFLTRRKKILAKVEIDKIESSS